jgi:hypothetical protein
LRCGVEIEAADRRRGGGAKGGRTVGIARELGHRASHRLRVARLDQRSAALPTEDLRDRADRGRHDGTARRHRLERRQPEAFVAAREEEDPAPPVEVAQLQVGGIREELRESRDPSGAAVAGQPDRKMGQALSHRRERRKAVDGPLPRSGRYGISTPVRGISASGPRAQNTRPPRSDDRLHLDAELAVKLCGVNREPAMRKSGSR